MRKGLLLLAFLFLVLLGHAQKLIVNEVSQGPIGNGPNGTGREYVELVVMGTPTCTQTTMDLRGWIVDDNNGWVKAGSGTGIANGAIRFKAVASWQAIPYGSIILIYNDNDKNPAITLANDPTDANNDKVYVLPASSSLLERNLDVPFNSGTATPGYAGATWSQGTVADSWGTVALRNGGDAMLTVDPAAPTVAAFSFAYGDLNPGANATVSVAVMDGGANAYLSDANYNQSASWLVGVVGTNETPGVGNTPANIAWINSMRAPATGLTVNPVSSTNGSTLCVGGTTTLSSTTPGGTWSSANSAVVSVNATTGVATAVAAGGPVTVTYTVTSGGCTGTATYDITVVASANAGTLSGGPAVCTGSTTTFSSNGTAGGTWSSSNPAVATINPTTGVATGVTAGAVTITYTVGSGSCTSTATAPLTVNATPVLLGVGGAPDICLGGTNQYTNTTPGGTWTSSNTANVTVNPATGLATGVAVGPSTITYTVVNGSCSASTSLNVQTRPLPVTGTISGPSTVCLGQSANYTSTVPGGNWTVSPSNILNVNGSTGIALGVNPGNVTLTYNVIDVFTCRNSTSTPVTVVAVNAGTLSGGPVCTGSTTTLTSNGNPGGVWSSSQPGIATIDPATGVATGIAAGSSTITYTVTTSGCSSTATTTLTVNAAPVLQPTTGPASVCAGGTIQLTNPLQPNGAGTWTATPSGLVTLTPTPPAGGPSIVNVTATAAGVATINFTASNAGCSSTVPFTLTINAIPAPGAIGGTSTVCVGGNTQLTNSLAGGTWSSGNTSTATINATTGVVTGVAAGTAPITYTVTSNGCTGTANTTVTVNAAPVLAPIGAQALCKGASLTLTPGTPGGSWTSANGAVATVSTAGLLTGVGAGNTQLTYTVSNGGCTASQNVAVTVNAASVTLNASATSITAGQSVALTPSWTGATPITVTAWTPAPLFPNQAAASQIVAPTATTTFSVTGTDANGCSATGTVTVAVTQPVTDDLFVPNYFTPNNDGRNDILYLYGSSITALDFRIFNQWGEQVFVSTDKSRGWDGAVGGKAQPVGVYMYVAKATLANGETRTLKGSINLIR